MSYTDKQEELLRSLDYVDPDMIAGAVARIDEKKSRVNTVKKNNLNLYFKLAAAAAACLAIIAIAWPTSVHITEYYEYVPPLFGAANSDGKIETTPEYNGSRGLLYEVNEDGETASFVGFGTCTDEDIVIASHYNGLPVVEMRNQPYYDANNHYNDFAYGNKYAKSLTISDTVKTVLGAIIDECPNLERVYVGASVEGFQTPFMNYPSKIVSIDVSPENENYSSDGNCLVDLRSKRLVWGCNTTVIPDDGSVEIIGAAAFMHAEEYSADYLPEGIRVIEPNAFTDCNGLVNLRLPSTLEKVYGSTFNICENLEVVDLNGYSVIAPSMFIDCTSLREIKGSENITFIDKSAFRGCTSLTINLSPALEKIADLAFAFLYQNGEAIINFSGTMAEWNAIEKADTWKSNSQSVTVNCTDGVIRLSGK